MTADRKMHGQIKKCIDLINEADSILLLPHEFADGDSLGSSGALAAFLRAKGKNVRILVSEPVDSKLSFLEELPGVEFETADSASVSSGKYGTFDLAIAIDSSTPDRLAERQPLFASAKKNARIDHHAAGTIFSAVTLMDTQWAATAEGIYLLLSAMGFDRGLKSGGSGLLEDAEKAVAICIYTALVTDTGCFAYSNVTPNTHLIASRMCAIAGDMSFIYHRVYEIKSRAYTRLMKTVYEKLTFPEDGIAVLVLTRADFDAAGAKDEDAEGIANVLRSIEGVHAGIFVKPDKMPGRFRVSLRSDSKVNVAEAAKRCGGGGHVCAAGCGFDAADATSVNSEISKIIDAVKASFR